jgi:hypothetical protein
MPVSVSSFLMLWSVSLLAGSDAGPWAGVEAHPAPRHLDSVAFAPHAIPTVDAMPADMEWPWRISEAENSEEESDEGDDLGPLIDDFSRGRLNGDRRAPSPIRSELGSFRSPFRSPILRC